MQRIGTKLLLAGLTLVLTPFLVEGLLSLGAGRSLRTLGRGGWLEELDVAPTSDAERLARAARTAGPFRVADDPLVAYTFKAATEIEFLGQRFATDALGLRREARAAPAPGDFQLVLLGDSVAFGHGLRPGEALGPRLEELLAQARASDEPRVCVTTVAVPGWNHWNSVRHLLDNLERVAPDLVLFLPVQNDIEDAFGTDEDGQRAVRADPTSATPLVEFRPPLELYRNMARQRHGLAALRLFEDEDRDQWRPRAALTRSAARRVQEYVANLALLQERLARAGAALALAPYRQDDLARMLRAGLLERGLALPELALLDELRREDGQGKDPHPSAETTRALAIWVADGLVEQGLLPRRSRVWPEVPARLLGRRARTLSAEELLAWRAEFVRSEAAGLDARIAPRELRGLNQIYGGVLPDAALAPEALFVLPPGETLALELEGLLDGPGLYPLRFQVEVEGEVLGTLELGARDGPGTLELALGPEARTRPFEVRILASDWAPHEVGGRPRLATARFVALESEP